MRASRSNRPRNLGLLIAAVTVLPFTMLLWLGWQLVRQDRLLEQQQVQQRVDRAADRAVSALQKKLSEDQRRVVTGVAAGGVVVFALGPPLPEAASTVFAAGEDLELRQRKLPEAIAAYRRLSATADRTIHAGALLRLARALQRSGRIDEALTTYRRLETIEDVAVAGVPASLVALYARGRLLSEENQTGELRAVGRELAAGLRSGRWALTPAVFELYARDAASWSVDAALSREAELFADALRVLRERSQPSASGRAVLINETFDISGQSVTVVWRTADDRPRAWVGTTDFVRSGWLADLPAIEAEEHVRIGIDGYRILGPNSASQMSSVRRHASDTGLPWSLTIASAVPPPERAAFALRQQLLAAGFFLLVIMSAAAGYLIVRSIDRELTAVTMQADFVAAVSHEFRTPLTTLRQFTDMLGEQRNLGADRLRTIADAQSRATERLTRLVESLLDFGRMEAGARRYRLEAQDSASIVQRVVDDFLHESGAAGHPITFCRLGEGIVDADAEALFTAIRNLIENAAKYSPGVDDIAVAVERRNGDVRISVQDRGLGIPEKEQRAIFTKFQRGEQARVQGISGTGIGLAIVSEIVAAHRGRVELESAVGHGSTFTIVLPAKE